MTWPLRGQDPSPFLQAVEVIQKAMKLLHASQLHQVLYTSKPKCTLLAECVHAAISDKIAKKGWGAGGEALFSPF